MLWSLLQLLVVSRKKVKVGEEVFSSTKVRFLKGVFLKFVVFLWPVLEPEVLTYVFVVFWSDGTDLGLALILIE